MLFHMFASQEQRRDYGGSAFIEMQFCKLPAGTKRKHIVAVRRIQHWQPDSLYIDDEDTFYREYRGIFTYGTYGNLKCGAVDLFGINYYAPESIDSLMETLAKETPMEYETLMAWLIKAKDYNGFYILGL